MWNYQLRNLIISVRRFLELRPISSYLTLVSCIGTSGSIRHLIMFQNLQITCTSTSGICCSNSRVSLSALFLSCCDDDSGGGCDDHTNLTTSLSSMRPYIYHPLILSLSHTITISISLQVFRNYIGRRPKLFGLAPPIWRLGSKTVIRGRMTAIPSMIRII